MADGLQFDLVYLPGEGTCNTGVFANTNTAISPTDPVAQSLFYASGGTASMLNPYNQPLSLGGYQSQLGGLGSQAPYGLLNAMQQNPNAVSPVSAQLAQPVSPVQTPTGAQTQTPPVSTSRSALKLLVQPAVVRSGRTALLAWTSVGMQSGSCRVRTGSSSIANSNEGSRVSAQLFEGTTFVLECKDHTGATVASEAVVQVE